MSRCVDFGNKVAEQLQHTCTCPAAYFIALRLSHLKRLETAALHPPKKKRPLLACASIHWELVDSRCM